MIIIFVSCETQEDAAKLANVLVDTSVAACVGVLPLQSYYYWNSEKVVSNEYELLIKTTEEKYEAVKKVVEETLSYDIPQIIAVPAEKVSEKYSVWVSDAVKDR